MNFTSRTGHTIMDGQTLGVTFVLTRYNFSFFKFFPHRMKRFYKTCKFNSIQFKGVAKKANQRFERAFSPERRYIKT